MELFYYLVASTVGLAVDALLLCMFVRAIFSFLPLDGALIGFFMIITEPAVIPVRKICEKFGLGEGLPIDIPFFITTVILVMVSAFV